MDLGLKGKSAIVTGVGSLSGIGFAIARALAEEGVKLFVTDRNADGLETASQALRQLGSSVENRVVDQTAIGEIRQAVAEVTARGAPPDILINCAALTSNVGSLSKMAPESWQLEIETSLSGPYYWIREVLPAMKRAGWGRIINVSSTNSLTGQPGVPAYVVAKGGLNALTRQVARECTAQGITCNTLLLGMFDTDIYEREQFDQTAVADMQSHILTGTKGEPADVGKVAAFFCSNHARFITGSALVIDGGMTINV